MGLWESVAIVTAFSIFVIVADEILHARRRKKREERGDKPIGGH
jgi:hypothetical protein